MGKALDLTGQSFGKLVVLENTGKRDKYGMILWHCRCDCGKEREVPGTLLKSGNTKSCGCGRARKLDLTGRRFGRLVAIEDTGKKAWGSYVWRCLCDCGNESEVSAGDLTAGRTKSCGCLQKELNVGHLVDLTGRRFGRLVVIKYIGKKLKKGASIWLCLCDCGNECEIPSNSLKSGNTRSCGCISREYSDSRLLDITGQRFGLLTALESTGRRNKSGSYFWRCRCDCGNICEIPGDKLKGGETKSCGCLRKEAYKFDTDLHVISSKKLNSNNTSGVKGVSLYQKGHYKGKYGAAIMFQKHNYRLGMYTTLAEAANARQRAEEVRDEFLDWYDSLNESEKRAAEQEYEDNKEFFLNRLKARMANILP
jgi:hypothetical protein